MATFDTRDRTDQDVSQIDSMILGAVESAARAQGLTLSSGAKDLLLTAARPHLDEAFDRGQLEDRRGEAKKAATLLIGEVVAIYTSSGADSHLVTAQIVNGALDRLCEAFPFLFPLCPRR